MNNKEIIDLINKTLEEEFEIKPENMRSESLIFGELGLDSLDIVDMVVVLEKAFQFKIREEKSIRQIRTLGDIHTFVISKKREIDIP